MVFDSGIILKITACKCDEGMHAQISSPKDINRALYRIKDSSGAEVSRGSGVCNGRDVTVSAAFESMEWSVQSPVLYTLEIELEYEDGTKETVSDRFGFRYLYTDEKNIYLNGYPFYMRAYIRGCAAHEHENNCSLPEYEFYKKNFTMAKSYGYNAVRFHSVVPTDECFRAADDCGIMVHIEMRRENADYDNLQEMLYGKNDFVTDKELIAIINRLYNHPSFMVYCVGNEIRQPGKKPRIREIRDFIKKHDPTRLFIDTCAHGEFDRDYVDFDVQHMSYYFPYGKNADMFSDTDNLLGFGTVKEREMIKEENGSIIRRGISFKRPLIAHEVCHYTSWRDYYALKEKFGKYGVKAPWWVDEEIKLLESKGYGKDFDKTLQITKDFQFRAWKNAIEAIRSSELLSGFHMLQFADTDRYENSNGVVDCFDDPHGISAEEFSKFNADTVILARLPRQIFASGDTVKIPVLLSRYVINPKRSADFAFSVTDGSNRIIHGTLSDVDTEECGLYPISSLEFFAPEVDKARKLTLECSLTFEGNEVLNNSWSFWVFPRTERTERIDAKCDMREDYLEKAFSFNENSPLTVTDKLDGKLLSRLENGEDVMLIYRTDWTRHLLHKDMEAPKYSFMHTWDRFKAVIWDRGTLNGGADDKEILEKYGFVTDGQIDFQYYPLIDDSDKINLDDFPVKVSSLVSGLDKACRDRFDATKFRMSELRPERTMRNFSYAFDVRVGAGRLLVTGFNFTSVDNNPAVRAMFKTLVNYCRSEDFGRGECIPVSEFGRYLEKCAGLGPQKEGMMTQYWQLDDAPVESMDYWTESERYLREDL